MTRATTPDDQACDCVMRDHIADEELPTVCEAFVGSDGDYPWMCATCGHETGRDHGR